MENNFKLQPVVSEKSFAMANASNKYTFLIIGKASKVDIKREVERKYKVKVENVNTTVRPGKMKRDWKVYKYFRKEDSRKAVVQVKKGDKIDEFLNI